MRDLQIFILDTAGNQLGELDLTDSTDFALKLTKSIASIRDIGRRNTSFSLDFEAPQTKNNNKLLSGLRFAATDKDILGQKPCSILVEGNQIDRGFVYPFESTFDGMYKLVFKGLNNDWVEKLRGVELNTLNWRDYITGLRTEDALELFTLARITTLNIANSVTGDITYPDENRNNGAATIDFKPQLHLRSIVISMFEKIGYTVSSAFLESDWVKGLNPPSTSYVDDFGNPYVHHGLSVDPTFQMTRDTQDLIAQTIQYSTTGIVDPTPDTWNANFMVGNLTHPTTISVIRTFYRFPNIINNPITDNFNRFNEPTSEYTVGLSGTYLVSFKIKHITAYWDDYNIEFRKFTFAGFGTGAVPAVPPAFVWHIVKNNTSDTAIDGTILYSHESIQGDHQELMQDQTLSLTAGEKICIFLEYKDNASGWTYRPYLNGLPNAGGSLPFWRTRIDNGSVLIIKPLPSVTLGTSYRINSHIPKGIKCLDLLQDFKTMFNLYFDVDVNRKVVFIEPRDDFYNGTFKDITSIVDLNTPPVLNYLTDYKNELVFKYATDSKDKYLEQYNKINDLDYAQLTYVMGNNSRFEKGQSTLTTKLLSPSIQGELENNAGIISSIIKEEYLDADNLGKPVNQNYAARVFQLVRGIQYTPANIARKTTGILSRLVGIMENYANTPTFEDRRLTFNATNGLVSQFYAKTLANIEDTVILTVKLNLSLYDFTQWDLRRVYHISEPAEIKGYYITDSVKNFNVTKETPTTVTLVRFKDFTPVVIAGGVGNVPL